MRTPPPPSPELTILALGCAAVMVRSGSTFVPGPDPATPPFEYQQPFSAFHVCHVPFVTLPWLKDGQSVEFWY